MKLIIVEGGLIGVGRRMVGVDTWCWIGGLKSSDQSFLGGGAVGG